MIETVPYIYETAVTYPDLGRDMRLSHKGALRMLQEAATLAAVECGHDFRRPEETGAHWVLAGWRLELRERPIWNTPLSVHTWPRTMEGLYSNRDFLLYAGDALIARATSRWLLLSIQTQHPIRIPPKIRALYERLPRAVFEGEMPGNGRSDPEAREACVLTAGRRDLDTNGHVNNLHYLDYALEAVPEEVYRHLPDTVEILFRRQILEGTRVRCLYSLTEDGRHQVELASDGEKPVHHAFIWLYPHHETATQ